MYVEEDTRLLLAIENGRESVGKKKKDACPGGGMVQTREHPLKNMTREKTYQINCPWRLGKKGRSSEGAENRTTQ